MKLKGLSRVFWSMIDLVLDKWNPLGTYEHEHAERPLTERKGQCVRITAFGPIFPGKKTKNGDLHD